VSTIGSFSFKEERNIITRQRAGRFPSRAAINCIAGSMEVNPALNADAIVDVPNGDDPTIEVNSSDTNFNDALQVRIHLYTCTVRWLCARFFFQ
jgi:hypothetical protein